jgi:integrase
MTMKLSKAAIANVRRSAAGKSEYIEWDDALPGFGLRVRDGRCTWVVQYKIGAKHRRITLGTTDELAAEQARNGWRNGGGKWHDGAAGILRDARQGTDAANRRAEARAEASKTLEAIVAVYLEAKQSEIRPRSYVDLKYHLGTLWRSLHELTLSAITRAVVAAQVRVIGKERGPATANRARASLSGMFRWAIGEGLCEANPVIGTNTQEESGPRDRTLTDAEAAAIWLAAPDNGFGQILRLLMLTGCRRTEIGDLRWGEIDLEARTITLPKERTKNGQEHVVPLCDAAVDILKAIPRRAGREFVFGIGRNGWGAWSKGKGAIDKATKLKEPWTLHDIRRTVRTGLGMLGVLPHVAEAALNHLPPKLIRTYDRNTYAAEKRTALELWANHLAVAVAQASGTNVTRLPSNKTA